MCRLTGKRKRFVAEYLIDLDGAAAYVRAGYKVKNSNAEGRTMARALVHHIKPVDQHPELRLDWDNLRSLCRACHEKRHGFD